MTTPHENLALHDAPMAGAATHPIPEAPPFTVEHVRSDAAPNGRFTPDARAVVNRTLRTSGLLAHLTDPEARTLLALLTLVTANGRIAATPNQVSVALVVSERDAEARLRELEDDRWHDTPIAIAIGGSPGLAAFSPSVHLIGHVTDPTSPDGNGPVAPYSPAGREAVIAHSRTAYGRPRAEVEREIAEQFGRGAGIDRTSPAGRLVAVGVPPDEALSLQAAYPEREITDQIEWLPHRGAKNPARFVVAAIEGRYEPPARVRLERAVAEGEGGPADRVGLELPESLEIPTATGADEGE